VAKQGVLDAAVTQKYNQLMPGSWRTPRDAPV